MLAYGVEQAVFGKGFGQVGIGAGQRATRTIEQAVARGQHDNRCQVKLPAMPDQAAGLIAIEARHQDVAENQRRQMVDDFCECFETVLSQHNLIAGLGTERVQRNAELCCYRR